MNILLNVNNNLLSQNDHVYIYILKIFIFETSFVTNFAWQKVVGLKFRMFLFLQNSLLDSCFS